MIIQLEEMKSYLRLDSNDEDKFIMGLSVSAENLCRDIARIKEGEEKEHDIPILRVAVLYAAAYLNEHREEADHTALTLSLRSLLSTIRRGDYF